MQLAEKWRTTTGAATQLRWRVVQPTTLRRICIGVRRSPTIVLTPTADNSDRRRREQHGYPRRLNNGIDDLHGPRAQRTATHIN